MRTEQKERTSASRQTSEEVLCKKDMTRLAPSEEEIKCKDERAAEILRHVPTGRENAITRWELQQRLGISDRDIRRAIHLARCEGYMICSTDKGYFISDRIEDVREQYLREKRRIANTYESIKWMRAWLRWKGVNDL